MMTLEYASNFSRACKEIEEEANVEKMPKTKINTS